MLFPDVPVIPTVSPFINSKEISSSPVKIFPNDLPFSINGWSLGIPGQRTIISESKTFSLFIPNSYFIPSLLNFSISF